MSDDPNAASNGWNEWSKHVLKELERLTLSSDALRTEFQDFKLNMQVNQVRQADLVSLKASIESANRAVNDAKLVNVQQHADLTSKYDTRLTKVEQELRYKAGMWGAIAGMIPAVLALIMIVIKSLT